MLENEQNDFEEEKIETPEVIDDGSQLIQLYSDDNKTELLEDFLYMIEVGEEFAEERDLFMKKWSEFMQLHNEALSKDAKIIEANERALKLNEKLGM